MDSFKLPQCCIFLQVFGVGFFATLCLVLPHVTSENPAKGTEILGYVASLLTVAFRLGGIHI